MYINKKILIIGAGKSGVSVLNVLNKYNNELFLYDDQEIKNEEILKSNIKIIKRENIKEEIKNMDLVIKSPGIKYENEIIKRCLELNKKIVNDVEIAYLISKNKNFISITGSNGKTTTTTLIGEILRKQYKEKVLVGGNIGTPISEIVENKKETEVVVAELSSFQLMALDQYKSNISVFLNITPAHLDYHGDLGNYLMAKQNIFKNQNEDDFSIINNRQKDMIEKNIKLITKKYYFDTEEKVENGAYYNNENDKIIFIENEVEKEIIEYKEVGLKGKHNLENVLVSVIVSMLKGVEIEALKDVLKSFIGVEHRLEFVKEKDGVKYYNDSKATNEQAAINALKSFNEPLIHICGGLDRGVDFEELKNIYKEKNIKCMIAYGQSKEKLINISKEIQIKYISAEDIVDAVEKANKESDNGDVVLLSPACASWDMYKTFEERGNIFKEKVKNL